MNKKILTIISCSLIFIVFLLFFAFAQSETNTGTYNETDKSMTIKDDKEEVVSVVKLISEHPRVIHNKDEYVMEIEIDSKKVYEDFLTKIDLENNLTKEKINRDITYKFFNLSGEHIEIVYEYKTLENGTEIVIGSHEEIVVGSWDYFNIAEPLKVEKLRLRLYDKNVQYDEVVDLIPTLFGIEIKEWATYALDEHYDTGDNTWSRIHDGHVSAQTFTPQSDLVLGKISILVYTIGQEGTLWGFIANTTDGTSEGAPDNQSIVVFFNNVSQGTIGVAPAVWYNLTFWDANASLCNNCTYAIVLKGTGKSDSKEYSWRVDSAGATYTYGTKWVRNIDGGTDWLQSTSADFMFRTWKIETPSDTCTCSAGSAWLVDCSDMCNITSACDLGSNNLTLYGTGTFRVLANITADVLVKDNDCKIEGLIGDNKRLAIE